MTIIGEAFIALKPSTAGFAADAEKELASPLRGVAQAAAGLAVGAKIFGIFRTGFEELADSTKTLAQTEAVIRSTGGVAGVTKKQVDELADSLSKLTGIDDENIVAGENLILTFKNIRNEVGEGNDIFDRATKAALDMSVAFSQDLSASAIQVGKALDNPIVGMTALRRVGVSFTEGQVELIKTLVRSGRQLDAQKVILAELEAQVAGSAEAFGETLPGKVQKAQNSLDAAKEQLIVGFAPALELGIDLVSVLARKFEDLPDFVQAGVGSMLLVGGGIVAVARPINELLNLFARLRPARIESAVATSTETVAIQANTRAVVQNSAASVENLYATQRTGRSIGGLGIAGLALIPVLTGVGYLLNKQSKQQAEAARTADLYTNAFRSQADQILRNVEITTRQELATRKIGNILRLAAEDVDPFVRAVQEASGEIDTLDQFASTGESGLSAFRHALNDGEVASTDLTRAIDAMAARGDLSGTQFMTLVSDLKQLRTGMLEGGQEAANMNHALAGTPQATDEAVGGLDELGDKLDELIENQLEGFKRALDELLGKPLAEGEAVDRIQSDINALAQRFEAMTERVSQASERVTDAGESVGDAQARLDELLATPQEDRGEDFEKQVANARDDLADANEHLAQTEADLAEAQADAVITMQGNSEQAIANRDALRGLLEDGENLIGVWAEQGIKGDELKAKIGFLSQSLIDQAEALGIPREEAEKYFGTLDRIPPSVLTILEADPTQAQAQIEAVLKMLQLLPGAGDFTIDARVIRPNAGGTAVALAEGGIAHARPGGTSATIAEAGFDEAVVPLPPGLLDGLLAVGSLAQSGRLGGFAALTEQLVLVTPDVQQSAIVLSRGLDSMAHRLALR